MFPLISSACVVMGTPGTTYQVRSCFNGKVSSWLEGHVGTHTLNQWITFAKDRELILYSSIDLSRFKHGVTRTKRQPTYRFSRGTGSPVFSSKVLFDAFFPISRRAVFPFCAFACLLFSAIRAAQAGDIQVTVLFCVACDGVFWGTQLEM